MTQMAFYLDGTRCTGCQTCVFSCRDYHNLKVGFSHRKTAEYVEGDTWRDSSGCHATTCRVHTVSYSCNHCDRPACQEVCPTGAMHRDDAFGLMQVDERKCIGCGYCHLSCPYGAPKVDRDLGRSVKCDGCQDRLQSRERPVCVEACPVRALDFGPVEAMAALGKRAGRVPFPDANETKPNLFMRSSNQAVLPEQAQGWVENAQLWK